MQLLFGILFSLIMTSQCPYQYGTGVYQARLFLSFIDTTQYYNACENDYLNNNNNLKLIEQNTENINDNKGFTVFPNPANDVLSVLNTSENTAIIEIYNYIGEKIISSELKSYSSIISIRDLNAGVYLYKIIANNEIVKSDKLIVIK